MMSRRDIVDDGVLSQGAYRAHDVPVARSLSSCIAGRDHGPEVSPESALCLSLAFPPDPDIFPAHTRLPPGNRQHDH
jgi:hypothetical protein